MSSKSKPSVAICVIMPVLDPMIIVITIIIIIIIIIVIIIIIIIIGSGRVTCLGGGLGVAGRFTCAA